MNAGTSVRVGTGTGTGEGLQPHPRQQCPSLYPCGARRAGGSHSAWAGGTQGSWSGVHSSTEQGGCHTAGSRTPAKPSAPRSKGGHACESTVPGAACDRDVRGTMVWAWDVRVIGVEVQTISEGWLSPKPPLKHLPEDQFVTPSDI